MTFADRLEELRKAATPGLWEEGSDGYSAIVDSSDRTLYYDEGTATTENNALILFLVNNADAILELVRWSTVLVGHAPGDDLEAELGVVEALAKLNGEQTSQG